MISQRYDNKYHKSTISKTKLDLKTMKHNY